MIPHERWFGKDVRGDARRGPGNMTSKWLQDFKSACDWLLKGRLMTSEVSSFWKIWAPLAPPFLLNSKFIYSTDGRRKRVRPPFCALNSINTLPWGFVKIYIIYPFWNASHLGDISCSSYSWCFKFTDDFQIYYIILMGIVVCSKCIILVGYYS